jgi:hypothetical protein
MVQKKRKKGLGYFGPLKRPDGMISTELSIGVSGPEYDDKEIEIPLLVPTLTKKEINYLLNGGEPTEEIIRKAEEHAQIRLRSGLSPFAQKGEQGELPGEKMKEKTKKIKEVPFEKKIIDLQQRKEIAKHVRETEEAFGLERGKKAFGKLGDVYKPGGKKFEKRMRQLEMKIATGKANVEEKAEYKKLKGE